MTWPGKDGTGVITLAFRPVEPKPEVMTSESGAWAWLRMLRGGNLQATDRPDLFRLRLSSGGYLRRLRPPGEQRRQPLRPADVLEVRVPGPDLIMPGGH